MKHQQVGPWLRSLREQQKLSLREVARRTGYDKRTMSLIERNLQQLTVEQVATVLEAMGATMVVTAIGINAEAGVELEAQDSALVQDFARALPLMNPAVRALIEQAVTSALQTPKPR